MLWVYKHLMGICGAAVLLLCSGCNSETALAPSTPQASQYRPTVSKPQEVGERLTDATVYTVDARSKDIWMYFDFSRGAVVGVQNPKTDDWDIALQRHMLRTNGGDTNPSGQGAILALPEADFAAVKAVPEEAEFVGDVRTKKRLHAYNPALQKWYSYSYTTNILIPKPVVYIVRTQDGKYAKMRILSYYCKDDVAGCVTFEYVYQGDGSPSFAASSARLSGAPGPR